MATKTSPPSGHRPAPELLAPAGNWECAKAAVENGADAIYFGLEVGFNARARAANFTLDQLPELMHLLHGRGVKGYVTLNTLVFTDELIRFESSVRAIASAGIDAVLVQDLGAARLIRETCPDLPIHASTQMTMTSAETIRMIEALGIERVVLARELSIDEIEKISSRTNMPLETFVHGALCVAYSGQCLTSESFGGRSANRGQCAQACRLNYQLIVDDRPRDLGDVPYLLSPQDLAAIELIPQLIAAGVGSLKIEGRLKTPEYVANVTSQYRRAIDSAILDQPFHLTPEAKREMELSFSRGFSPGWLEGCDHKRLVPGKSSAKRGVEVGQVVALRGERLTVDLILPLAKGDGIVLQGDRVRGTEIGGRIYAIYQNGKPTDRPTSGRVELMFEHGLLRETHIRSGQAIWQTDDPQLTKRLRATFNAKNPIRRLPIEVHVIAKVGHPLSLVVNTGISFVTDAASVGSDTSSIRHVGSDASSIRHEELLIAAPMLRFKNHNKSAITIQSEYTPEKANKHPIDKSVLEKQLGRLGGSNYELTSLSCEIDGEPMIPLSILGALRHKMIEMLDAACVETPSRQLAEPGVAQRMLTYAKRERGDSLTTSATRSRGTDSHTNAKRERGDETEPRPSSAPLALYSGRGVGGEGFWERPLDASLTHRVSPDLAGELNTTDPILHVLCRSLKQLEAILESGVRDVYVDFHDIRQYRDAVRQAHSAGSRIHIATLRIHKPAENGLFLALARHAADGWLVRNLAALHFATEHSISAVGDFSLNVTNPLTAEWLISQGLRRLTASYDLNRDQLLELVSAMPTSRLEIVIHQHMPMFHMEHCVFCSVMSPGTNKSNCGRPCDRHDVKLKDRVGVEHVLHADIGCRNTLFNGVAQSGAEAVKALRVQGVRDFRIELLRDAPSAEILRLVGLYRDLLAGQLDGAQVWKALRADNRVGVTRGTLEQPRNPLAIL